MDNLYERYNGLAIDGALIALSRQDNVTPYFCYPLNAQPIGYEGCIMYCFIEGYGEMVFAANPESCAAQYVYPLADSFADFLRLILACGSVNPIEQIVWMNRTQFEEHLKEEAGIQTPRQKETLALLAQKLALQPLPDPFGYVKALQAGFDDSLIHYSSDYYDTLGITPPPTNSRL